MVNWGLLSQLTLAISVVLQAYLLFSPNSLSFPFSSLSNPQGSLQAPPTTSPYTSSWGSWLHPQSTRKSYDVGVGTEDRMLELVKRIQDANISLKGDLEFVNRWNYFTFDPQAHFEQLTTTGPFAGTLEAFTTGVKLRTRYEHLLPSSHSFNKTNLWASDSNRVIETARYFAAGLFGLDWQKTAHLHIIPETADRGADTLTPGDTCLNYADNVDPYGHDYGARMLMEYRSTYLPAISDRLLKQNPDMQFTDIEVYSMQEMCGFETTEEWLAFEYARDVIHYYRAGPGNPYGAVMGWLWLNATANLLAEGPESGPLFFSFVHDGDIIPLLAALALFPTPHPLPTTHIAPNRTYLTSQLTPMGGRIIFERLTCPAEVTCWSNAPLYPNHVYCEEPRDDVFVRVNANDGIVAIPGCDGGPGRSCALEGFLERVRERGRELGDFRKKCGLGKDARERITFLHQ
ncbi:hypothetical protein B0A49_10344 [Cryomyces minteri]|uniref:Phosphoglycerate mutase-like protein n=1 Tax=Cryomyces minteri TaxID=331657 RepID=A0A4U0WIJ0_9PEZI|nr:hypothetical protein B0A49_10344 [Cryomyces minteri]